MGSVIDPLDGQNSCVADNIEVVGIHRRIGADRAPAPGVSQGADTTCPGTSTLPPADPADEHTRWLDALPHSGRDRYDRAFGRAWSEGKAKEECRRIARQAVEGFRHVGPGSNISVEAEQSDEEEVLI
jgi:hypothetical protein